VAKFLVKLEKDVNTFQIKLEENVTKLQVMLVKDVNKRRVSRRHLCNYCTGKEPS
jgi:hypothetical protein